MKNFLKRFWTIICETFMHPTVVSVIDEEGNVVERDGKPVKRI